MPASVLEVSLIEVVPLACYVVFMFFAFCDGFKLRPFRKIIWAIYFLTFCYISFVTVGYFDLTLIVPLASMLGFGLAWFQNHENKQKAN